MAACYRSPMMNPGWILLADPERGDRMWRQVTATPHVERGTRLTVACGREATLYEDADLESSPPAGAEVCLECAAA